MVRILALAVATVAALISVDATVVNYPQGVYYRPCGSEVSGRVGTTAEYTRSPCPALNSMANHGFIPRDGRNLSRPLLRQAIIDVFNIDPNLADIIVGLSPDTPTFNLATLSMHNAIEHDVSLTRRDVFFEEDQAVADPFFLGEIVLKSLDGQLSLENVADIRSNRIRECKAKNPQCDFGPQQQFIANAESGLLLRGIGGKNTESVPLANVVNFLVQERFPDGFKKPSTPITFEQITNTSNALIALQIAP